MHNLKKDEHQHNNSKIKQRANQIICALRIQNLSQRVSKLREPMQKSIDSIINSFFDILFFQEEYLNPDNLQSIQSKINYLKNIRSKWNELSLNDKLTIKELEQQERWIFRIQDLKYRIKEKKK